jgi:protein subunit release factor A
VGVPRPRGYTFPSLRVGKRTINLIFDVLEKAREGGDIKEIVESEIEKFVSSH